MSNFIYSANGDVADLENNIETMADVSKPLDYFNLAGNLRLAGSIKATDFIKDDGKPLDTVTVTKLALPKNVYYADGKVGINENKPTAALDVKGKVKVQGETQLKKTIVDGLLKVGRDDTHPWNAGWGNGVHTWDLKVDATADINNLNSKQFSTTGNANVQGDLVFNGSNKWILHTPDDGRKTMYIAPGNDKGEWQWGLQTTIDGDGKVRVGNHLEVPAKMTVGSGEDPRKLPEWLSLSVDHPKHDSHIRLKTKNDDGKNTYLINRDGHFRLHQHGVGDVFGVNHDGHTFIHSNYHVPLNVSSPHDTHIQLKSKNDDNKNVYLINRDGHFRVHAHGKGDHFGVNKDGHAYFHSDHTHIPLNVSSKHDAHLQLSTKGDANKNIYLINRDGNFKVHTHGVGDMFGVEKNGHHYVRHTGDHVMHVEGDGANPYISLGKTGTWGGKKLYIQNVNAGSDEPTFRVGVHDKGPMHDMSRTHGARWARKDGRWTHFDHTDGRNYIRGPTTHDDTFTANRVQLGNKWLMSGVGDGHANDDWLRLMNTAGSNYHGGFAAGRLWTGEGRLAGSDKNMKENITKLNKEQILSKISKLNGYIYNLKKDEKKKKKFGVLAQEISEQFPEIVEKGPNGLLAVDYDQLISLLIESVKELNARCPK